MAETAKRPRGRQPGWGRPLEEQFKRVNGYAAPDTHAAWKADGRSLNEVMRAGLGLP